MRSSLSSWFRDLRSSTRAPRKNRRRPAFVVELLENRLTPASSLGTAALVEGPSAGSDSDMVVVASGAWTATSNASWLHTTSSSTGNGPAVFTFDANTGATRTGTLTIAGQNLTVTQAGSGYVAANPVTTLFSDGSSAAVGVAVDGSNNVDVLNFGTGSADGAVVQWNATTQSPTTIVNGLNEPFGIGVDRVGNLYFETLNNGVQEWNASTKKVSTLFSGLYGPMAVDSTGNVYVVDANNSKILEWNAATQQLSTLISTGIDNAESMVCDVAGDLYISNSGDKTVLKWDASTGQLQTVLTNEASEDFVTAVDSSGNLYLSSLKEATETDAVTEWDAATQSVTTLVSGSTEADRVAVDSLANVDFTMSGAENTTVQQLSRAYVPGASVLEPSTSGSDTLAPVLPTTEPLNGIFAPTSDQGWLTIGSVNNGAVNFSFTTNFGNERPAHIELLGQQLTVTQPAPQDATVTTPTATSVTSISVILGGMVTSAGSSPLSKRGILYAPTSLNADPTPGSPGVVEVDDQVATLGMFSENISGLTPATSYSYVAFGIDGVGESFTPVATFTTLTAAPSVTAPTSTAVTSISASLGGTVSSNGGANLTKRGILYAPTSSNANPIIGGAQVVEVDDQRAAVGTYAEGVSGLNFAIKYSYVAFATNSIGTSYSTVATFTTLGIPATVTAPTSASVTSMSAILGGNVTADGGSSLTKRGILYAPTASNSNPVLGGAGIIERDDAAAITGVFMDGVPNLSFATNYSYVAFATNSLGTSYSAVAAFTTLGIPATVTAPTSASVTSMSAILGGNVTADGGSSLTKRGILYAPTASNSSPELGGQGVIERDDAAAIAGVFTDGVISLSFATNYSYVAFATNSVGTSYSVVASFTTLCVSATVTTPTSTFVTSLSATLGGNVTSDGGASITKRGILYAPSAKNPTLTLGSAGVIEINDASANTGGFKENVTSLSFATGYSFVAFATNSVGTSYSNVASFTTLPIVPTVASPTATAITSSIATMGGNVTGTGGAAITKRGILYAPTAANGNPTLGGTGVVEVDDPSATTGSFAENIAGLTPNTAYTFVAFATNSAGAAYSSIANFTTTPYGPASNISGPNSGYSGQSLTFTLNGYDPIPGMQLYYFTFHINWGDGKMNTVTGLNGTTIAHTYASAGAYTIQMSATDGESNTLPTGTLTVQIVSKPSVVKPLQLSGIGAGSLTAPSMAGIVIGSSASNYDEPTDIVDSIALNSIMAESLRLDECFSSNGSVVLNAKTISDDGAIDSLFGGIAGQEWFIS